MQQNERNGWRTLWLVLGAVALAAAGLCVVFRLERRLVQLCRTAKERLSLRRSRFEMDF